MNVDLQGLKSTMNDLCLHGGLNTRKGTMLLGVGKRWKVNIAKELTSLRIYMVCCDLFVIQEHHCIFCLWRALVSSVNVQLHYYAT
jgi:hypothetical protein